MYTWYFLQLLHLAKYSNQNLGYLKQKNTSDEVTPALLRLIASIANFFSSSTADSKYTKTPNNSQIYWKIVSKEL